MLQTDNGNYFGVIVGRCANRIANAAFTINGKQHRDTANDGLHSLHGGKRGWGMQVAALMTLMHDHQVMASCWLALLRSLCRGTQGISAIKDTKLRHT